MSSQIWLYLFLHNNFLVWFFFCPTWYWILALWKPKRTNPLFTSLFTHDFFFKPWTSVIWFSSYLKNLSLFNLFLCWSLCVSPYLVSFLCISYVICVSFIGKRPRLCGGDEEWICKSAQCLWFLSLIPSFFLSVSWHLICALVCSGSLKLALKW